MFEALHGVDSRKLLLLVNLRVQPCMNLFWEMCWLWKEPLWFRRFEQYTLLVRHSPDVETTTALFRASASPKRDLYNGCTRKFTSNSYFLFYYSLVKNTCLNESPSRIALWMLFESLYPEFIMMVRDNWEDLGYYNIKEKWRNERFESGIVATNV